MPSSRPRYAHRRRLVVGALGAMLVVAALVAGAVLVFGGEDLRVPGASFDAEGGERPNVVVIMTDDQDVDSLRVMPTVRRELGGSGVSFGNSFATFPLCCPSRVTFLTGQYAHTHGVRSNEPPNGGWQAFRDPEGTLPRALQDAGYRTGHVGKYLNGYARRGNDPNAVPSGWDEWWGFPEFELFDYPVVHNGDVIEFGNAPSDYETDVLGRLASEFVRESSSGPDPFFLWVAPLAPHTEARGAGGPMLGRRYGERNPRPAPRHAGRFENAPLPRPPSFNEPDLSDKPPVQQSPPLSDREVAALEESHQDRLASLLAVDDMVGRILDELRATGELENTIVVFTSDNGYLEGEHRLQKKSELYEESARVPLLMRGPGLPRGAEARQIVGNVDLPATILDAADAEPGRPLEGRSLFDVARDPDEAADRALLLETKGSRAVRADGFMYADYGDQQIELYDLRRDPFQLRNVAGSPRYSEVESSLADLLGELRDCEASECLRTWTREGGAGEGAP